MLNRITARLPRLTVIVMLLMLTLLVASALAWQAHKAARSHEAAAARVQRDYVEFAGWEFSRAVRVELGNRLERWLQLIDCGASGGQLPQPGSLSNGASCKCDDLRPRTVFYVDLLGGDIKTTGEPLGPEAERWVRAANAGERRIPMTRRGHVLNVGRIDGEPRLLVVAHAHDKFGAPTGILGFAADVRILNDVFSRIARETPLLPPTLAGTKNELLNVSVRSKDGIPVHSSAAPALWVQSEGRLEEAYDNLTYQIALKPEAAEKLVIGGLPRSRVPLLLGLLALTAGLLGVAVQQLRREHDLTRLRTDFVASVSHELRTLLAQIRLFSETLLLGRVRSEIEGRRSLEIIQQESRRLTHLVENVLYFSRSERGTQHLSPAQTRIGSFAAELIEAFAPLARSGRATVKLDVRTDVEAPVDAGALRQILLNLLDNAVKYGGSDRSVAVTVDQDGARAVILVDDEGPGVPAEARMRIWQPYSRLSTAATSAVAGTGIGLAVVHDLVELHGGSVRVEDAPAGGARFVVELPGAVLGPAVPAAERSQVPA